MNLYNLWRFRIGFSALLVVEGVAAAVAGSQNNWPSSAVVFSVLVLLLCAAMIFPWTRDQRPARLPR